MAKICQCNRPSHAEDPCGSEVDEVCAGDLTGHETVCCECFEGECV